VLVSGVNDDAAVIGAFRSGACDFLAKPFSTETLRSIVSRVLDIGARLHTVESMLETLAEENTELADQVDKIRRQQQQINRLLAVSAR
jgi:FixJ family two-component response regulator